MTRVHVLVASLLVGLGVLCQPQRAATADDNEMIVAGTEAPEGKYPYQVRLYWSMEDQIGLCGGSLIASQWVLTASHCLAKESGQTYIAREPDEIVVGYGSNDRTKTTKVGVEKIFVRPEYLSKGLGGKADVALIKLKKPVANAKIIPLADPETDKKLLVPGAKLTVTGWGTLWTFNNDIASLIADFGPDMKEKLTAPLRLREVQIDAMDGETCKSVFAQADPPETIAETEICAMQRGTPKDTCQGDSGGPLVVPADVPGGFIQAGVVSWGRGCGGATPGIYARVSPFRDWIQETIKNN